MSLLASVGSLDIYERRPWLGLAVVFLGGIAIGLVPRLAIPLVGMAALLVYLRPTLKTMVALMFAVFPFMYMYTYIQSFQGVRLGPSDVPVMYRGVKDVVVVLVLFKVATDHMLRGETRVGLSWSDICVGLFLLDTLATSFQSLVNGQGYFVSVLGIRNTSLCLIFYYLARLYFTSWDDYGRFARLIFWTGVAVAVLGIIQFTAIISGLAVSAFGSAGERSASLRVFSTMNDPNMYGMYLASCLLLARKDLLEMKREWRLGGMAILAAGLLLSLSFSVLIPLSLLFGLFIFTGSLRRPKLAFAGTILITAALLSPGLASRIVEIGSLTDVSLQLKLVQMQKAIELFLAHPIIGSGYGVVGQSGIWADSDYEVESVAGENYYLILAAQSGAVGVVLLSAALGAWWWDRRRIKRAMRDRRMQSFIRGVTASVFVFCVANLVTDHYEGFPNNFLIWFLMGAVVVAGRLHIRRQECEV